MIKRPMDLGTIQKKIEAAAAAEGTSAGGYQSPAEFAADVRLVFQNAFKYNTGPVDGRDVRTMARILFQLFDELMCEYFGLRWERAESGEVSERVS